MDEKMEQACFSIISTVGIAKSLFIESITCARNKEYDKAYELIKEGEKVFASGHDTHLDLIKEEASGNNLNLSLLLVHAEDQLMNADTFKILALEFIELYKKVEQNEK